MQSARDNLPACSGRALRVSIEAWFVAQGASGGVEFGGRPAAPTGDSFVVPPPPKV